MIDISQIQEHMEVVGSDQGHVGTLDNVGIKTTKSDPAAHDQHHYFKLDMIQAIENGKIVLKVPAQQAFMEEKAVEN